MSARKAPQCRKCFQPMRGHKADFCSVSPSPGPKMKEEEDLDNQSSALYLSPPPSPPPPSESPSLYSSSSNKPRPTPVPPVRTHREYTPDIMSEASFIIPETGYFHRRNPYFRQSLAPQLMEVPLATGSLAPTEIIGSEDAQTVTPSVRSASPTSSEWPQTAQAGSSSSREVLQGLGGLFAVHATPLQGGHVERLRERAGDLGLHTAVMNPPRTFGVVGSKAWVLTGPNMDAITEFIDVVKTEAMNSRFMRFIYDILALAPLFVVCLTASVLGGYICKTYL